MTRRLAILSAPGSRGDVNPMLAIATELDKLGYECVLSVAEPYADLVQSAGFQAHVVIDRETFEQVASQDQFWRPWSGAKQLLAELADKFLLPHLQFIDARYRPGETVLVAHPLDFASRIFRETTPGAVLSSVHLAPSMMRHPAAPPRMLPDRGWYAAVLPQGWSRLNRMTYFLADHGFLDRLLAPSINRARRRRGGLAPQRRFLHQWWCSPDQLLGLYPAWFAPEIAARYAHGSDQVAPLQCLGFPLEDGAISESQAQLPPTDRPLLVTTGSAHHGDEQFVLEVADQCHHRGVPVVWCCPANPHRISHPNVRSVGYIPLGEWLPHCVGIIHHGGIGTTSRAIHAGVPQLIRPMAFDQFDNASRVQRFGLGVWLRRDRDLPAALTELLGMSPNALALPPDAIPAESIPAAKRAAELIARLVC